ncbi:hypothetical protein BKA70DRAFT_1431692 [Coprinopsis sp. MPI-PUGE-AT-0042]|nr:hypothetical protein BKA70DRAFT_1431692 [Coprinopsis sp. MPI-PUGE-AT-0042]
MDSVALDVPLYHQQGNRCVPARQPFEAVFGRLAFLAQLGRSTDPVCSTSKPANLPTLSASSILSTLVCKRSTRAWFNYCFPIRKSTSTLPARVAMEPQSSSSFSLISPLALIWQRKPQYVLQNELLSSVSTAIASTSSGIWLQIAESRADRESTSKHKGAFEVKVTSSWRQGLESSRWMARTVKVWPIQDEEPDATTKNEPPSLFQLPLRGSTWSRWREKRSKGQTQSFSACEPTKS